MARPRICAVITGKDLPEVKSIDRHIDFFEVRIDLIGKGWADTASRLNRPWIATNRKQVDGGKWSGAEDNRLQELLKASEMGAKIVDLELETPDIQQIIKKIDKRSELLISHHNFDGTPSLVELTKIVEMELNAGAKICKVVTKAKTISDNITLIELVNRFSRENIISFGMGDMGIMSRVVAPLAGSYLSYASIKAGQESAPGQPTVEELIKVYSLI